MTRSLPGRQLGKGLLGLENNMSRWVRYVLDGGK